MLGTANMQSLLNVRLKTPYLVVFFFKPEFIHTHTHTQTRRKSESTETTVNLVAM